MSSYISLINESEFFGNINASSIKFHGAVDFTDASPITGLVDNITLEMVDNPLTLQLQDIIQVKDGGITNVKIVSMDANKITGHISISGSPLKIFFNIALDMLHNNIINVGDIIPVDNVSNLGDIIHKFLHLYCDTGHFETKINTPIIDHSLGVSLRYNDTEVLKTTMGGLTITGSVILNSSYVSVSGIIYPVIDNGYMLGLSTNRWMTVYTKTIDSSDGISLKYNNSERLLINNTSIDTHVNIIPLLNTLSIGSDISPFKFSFTDQVYANGLNAMSASTIMLYDEIHPSPTNGLNLGSAVSYFNTIYVQNIIPGINSVGTLGQASPNRFFSNIYCNTYNANGPMTLSTSRVIPYADNAVTLGDNTLGRRYQNIYTYALELNGVDLSTSLSAKVNKSGDTMTGQLIGTSSIFGNIRINNTSGYIDTSSGSLNISSSGPTNITGASGSDVSVSCLGGTLFLESTNGVQISGAAGVVNGIQLSCAALPVIITGTGGLRTTLINHASGVNIQHNGSTKLATSSTGVTVTGRMTSTTATIGTLTGYIKGTTGVLSAATTIPQADVVNLVSDLASKLPLTGGVISGSLTVGTLAGYIKGTAGLLSGVSTIPQADVVNLTTDLSNKLALAGGTMSGAINMGANNITNCNSLTINTLTSSSSTIAFSKPISMTNVDTARPSISLLNGDSTTVTGNCVVARFDRGINTSFATIDLIGVRKWEIRQGGSSGTGGFSLIDRTSLQSRLEFDDAGAVYFNTADTYKRTNTSWTTYSDARIKENIRDATRGLNDIMKVKIREYNFTKKYEHDMPLDTRGQTHIGFIAQEVREVFPECVKNSTICCECCKCKEDILTVNPHAINMALIRAVQELSLKLDKAIARISILEGC